MPSRHLYVVRTGKDWNHPEEVYVVAAYGREQAVELALGKYTDIEWLEDKKSLSTFRTGSYFGEVLTCWSWSDGKMVRKTERNFYVQVRDGYVFRNEEELKDYLNKFAHIPSLRKFIVFIDRFGRCENVKEFIIG